MECIASDCTRESCTRAGYCVMHYKRWKRNGTEDCVLNKYAANELCYHCKSNGPLSKGLCNACYMRLARKGYVERDVAPHGEGTITKAGYKLLTINGERVYEHREVTGALKGEVVHHKDGDRTNNHPDNLKIFINQSEHMKHHQQGE